MNSGYYGVKSTWQKLGTPDFGRMTGFLACLPKETRDKLPRGGMEMLAYMGLIMWEDANRVGKQKASCYVSQEKLAERINRTSRTVQRQLNVLRDLGLIEWENRKPARFKDQMIWRTNIYRPGKKLLQLLYTIMRKNRFPSDMRAGFGKFNKKPARTPMSYNNRKNSSNCLKKEYNKKETSMRSSFLSLKENFTEKPKTVGIRLFDNITLPTSFEWKDTSRMKGSLINKENRENAKEEVSPQTEYYLRKLFPEYMKKRSLEAKGTSPSPPQTLKAKGIDNSFIKDIIREN